MVQNGDKSLVSILTAFAGLTAMISVAVSLVGHALQRSFDRMISYDE